MFGVIIYYVVGPVHPHNLTLIAKEMTQWTFRIAYEPTLPWFRKGQLEKIPFETIALHHDKPPEKLWAGDVRAVIFSTVQPRPAPLNLLYDSLNRGVPTIAIEESNQIALNKGIVNNYLMPVDHLLVASKGEQQGMVSMGIPEQRMHITGWPFYKGKIGKVTPERQQAIKKRLGLDPERPVAALTLTGLNDAGESPTVRRRQLTLAAQGLPAEYQFVVKPHPIETLDRLQPFIDECAPQAKVIEGTVPIDDLLSATDILLNRGVSQVCIEALFQEIPVVVLDTGVQTPFHSVAQNLIVEHPEDLPRILYHLSTQANPLDAYTTFKDMHIPFSPLEARRLTGQHIEEIALNGLCSSERVGQWLDLALYQSWQVGRQLALGFLAPQRIPNPDQTVIALKQLLQYQASRADLEILKQYFGPGFRSHVLQCLWLDQLYQRHETPTQADITWLEDFPPQLNASLFFVHIARWADLLIQGGQ